MGSRWDMATLLVASITMSCVSIGTRVCEEDGLICAPGQVCDKTYGCVLEEQKQACVGLDELTLAQVPGFHCISRNI